MFDYVVNSLEKGGWVLAPIFICSIMGWFYIFEIWKRLAKLSPKEKDWVRKFSYVAGIKQWVRNLTKRNANTIPGIILSRVYLIRDSGRSAMLNSYNEEMKCLTPLMESGLSTLGVLASVAPLLGLLGTVSGMVGTFSVISVFGAGNPALMADSIGEALVTTQNGLLAAIPLMIAHIMLLNKSINLEQEVEKAAHVLINHIDFGDFEEEVKSSSSIEFDGHSNNDYKITKEV